MTVALSDEDIERIADAVYQRMQGAPITGPMTVEQLSKVSGMHADTIRKRVRSGDIRRVPHTARILVPARECERIISGK